MTAQPLLHRDDYWVIRASNALSFGPRRSPPCSIRPGPTKTRSLDSGSGDRRFEPPPPWGQTVDVYPLVRLRKLRPDGTAYVSCYLYRLPDKAGFVRLFVPPRTPRLHAAGSWTPDGIAIVAIDPARPYVFHWLRGEERAASTLKLPDPSRSGRGSFLCGLYLDLACEGGDWRLLDEAELLAASEDDARLAQEAIAHVRQLIAPDSPLFDASDDMWSVPADAISLEPRRVLRGL